MQIIALARDKGRSKTCDALERDGGDAAYALWSRRSDVRDSEGGRTPRAPGFGRWLSAFARDA
jgi:hypothetical protein